MRLERSQARRLASELRQLREKAVPNLTQADLAKALSVEGRVAGATLSSWESDTNPKAPSAERLKSYARFFCTPRSLEGAPHLIPDEQLSPTEREFRDVLQARLLKLANPAGDAVPRSFQFDEGPVVVICPTVPPELQDELADENDRNFTKLRQYGDLDALIELYGHLRAENPQLDVFHRLGDEVTQDDLSQHLVLLGGIGWNRITRRLQHALRQVPVAQTAVADLTDGDIFQVGTGSEAPKFYPEFDDFGDGPELTFDVGYLARLRNPFKANRTLTICNGIFSRGVFGAVRCLTHDEVRRGNESYLAQRFPQGDFAILMRVPVVTNSTISPDLQDHQSRLFEWAPTQSEQG